MGITLQPRYRPIATAFQAVPLSGSGYGNLSVNPTFLQLNQCMVAEREGFEPSIRF